MKIFLLYAWLPKRPISWIWQAIWDSSLNASCTRVTSMSTPFQQFWTQSYIWIKLSKLMEMEIQWMLIWSLSPLGKILEYHYQMPLVWSKYMITKIVTAKARIHTPISSYFHKLFSTQNICQTITNLGFFRSQKYIFF